MTDRELRIKRDVEARVDQLTRLVLCDAEYIAMPLTVDDEGFVWEVEELGTVNQYWSRFDDVVSITPNSASTNT